MADTKITALTAITTVDPAVDVLPIVDVSDTTMAASGTTKKITSNQILGAGGTATLASATITGDLTVDTNVLKVDTLNNRVGIGTATPDSLLQMAGAGTINWKLSNTSDSVTVGAYAGTTTGTTGTVSNHPFFLFTNNTERYRLASDGVATWSNVGGVAGTAMTLNSTGLGVGVSPATKLDVRGTINGNQAIFTGTVNRGLIISTRSDGLADDRTVILNAQHSTGAQGQLVLQTVGTDRLLIDSSGNVGIGVTPSAWGGLGTGPGVLQMGNAGCSVLAGGAGFSGTNQFFINNNAYYNATGGSSFKYYRAGGGAAQYSQVGNEHQWKVSSNTPVADTAITFTQAMTLDASGNLLVGTTTNGGNGVSIRPSTASPNVVLVGSDTSGGTAWQLYSTGTSSNRFYVTWAGVVNAVNTTISGISDARLKENVQDIDVGLGAILALKPRKFDWKAGKGKDIKGDRGFIAQEFEQVFPQLVDEWADPAPEGEAPYKSVRQDLIPVLVKAIQELTARVQTLETR